MLREITAINGSTIFLDCFHNYQQDELAEQNLAVGDKIECKKCASLVFPDRLKKYKQTPSFTENSVPKGFLRAHSTKKGTWGKIVIETGMLHYVIDHLENKSLVLDEETPGIISPTMIHHVEANWDVSFHIEFYTAE